MKKLVSLIVCLSVLVSSLCINASALSPDTYGTENEYVENSAYGRNLVTVSDIDSLMGNLSDAILSDDTDAAENIRQELVRSGAIPTSYSEVLKLTGTTDSIPYVSDVNIEFNTVYSKMYKGGKAYDIMRIYATPERGSDMFHEGTANSNSSPNIKAGSANFVKTWGDFGTGYIPVIGTFLSIYDALKSSISGFMPNNVVENIYVQYVYRCIENTTFLYVWNENSNNWSHMGTCSRLGTRVISIVDDITVDNFAALPGGYEKTYTSDIKGEYYNDVGYFYNYWWAYGACFEMQADKFSISGAAGENSKVAVVRMVSPTIPAVCR